MPRSVPRRGTALSDIEVARFLHHARVDVYHPLWHLALATGLRRAELLGLRWQDVDLDRGVLLVRQTGVWVDGKIKLQPRTKTPSSMRAVALDEGIVTLLIEHRARQSRLREKAGEHWKEHGLVISSDVGTPVGAPNMHRNYKHLLKLAGLPTTVKIHDLRHTHLSALLNAGVPVTTVAERGGYRNANVLLSVYAHAQAEGQRMAATVAGKLVGGGDEGQEKASGGEMAGK
jgi:integrase